MSQEKPNIILIISDQHRGDAMHCMGNDFINTPNLDGLAEDGTLFTSGYTSAPSSTPARAGLLTGMSPWHHGMLGYGRVGSKYKYEMPAMLKENGYFTFGIGKMHWFPQKALHGFHGTLVDESGRVESEDFISDYRLWLQMQAPGINPDSTGIGWNDHGSGVYKLAEELHPTAWTGKMACEMIRNHKNGTNKPLFLKVSFARPHSPYDPPKRFAEMYEGKDVEAPFISEWCKERDYAKLTNPKDAAPDAPYGNFGIEYAKESRRHYYANVTFIDEEIGKIIDALKDEGMYENSIICYVSDHGDMLGDHHHWRKTYPYEGSTHIPFIVKWPSSYNFAKGQHIDSPVELRDLLPTFLDVAGTKVPEDMDGLPLTYLLNGNENKWRKYIDLEHATCYSKDNYWCALTDGKIKYVWRFSTGEEELFDLKKDPQENHNVIHDKRYNKVYKELRKAMIEHLSERGDEFVKDGELQILKRTVLYSPLFPDENPVDTGI
ncbi:arylsulfatase [uncultured Bacteroides sp.]|uniref:arylsulfatase n=1 Tax=uncultured Bacteroides sp. TaxID=162156 RepID=UPI002626E213|nr:arylsulfatase [uncultured Bacteroides sp.]